MGRLRETQRDEDLGAHLVARAAYGRTQVYVEVFRPGSGPGRHHRHPLFQDPTGSPTPTGVEEGHGPSHRIDDEDRHAVGGGDGEKDTRRRGGVAVASLREMQARVAGTMKANFGPMYLVGMYRTRESDLAPQSVPPFQDRPWGRSIAEKPQIKGVLRDASGRGPLDEPRERTPPSGVDQRRRPREGDLLHDAEGDGSG